MDYSKEIADLVYYQWLLITGGAVPDYCKDNKLWAWSKDKIQFPQKEKIMKEDCAYWWVEDYHSSLEHCILRYKDCPGDASCPLFIDCEDKQSIDEAIITISAAKLNLVKVIPYADLTRIVKEYYDSKHNIRQ